jgi:hypothetical protein
MVKNFLNREISLCSTRYGGRLSEGHVEFNLSQLVLRINREYTGFGHFRGRYSCFPSCRNPQYRYPSHLCDVLANLKSKK